MKVKVIDIKFSKTGDDGTSITPINALGARVLRTNFPGVSDFNALGVPVQVKMPVAVCKSLVRGRGARFATAN